MRLPNIKGVFFLKTPEDPRAWKSICTPADPSLTSSGSGRNQSAQPSVQIDLVSTPGSPGLWIPNPCWHKKTPAVAEVYNILY